MSTGGTLEVRRSQGSADPPGARSDGDRAGQVPPGPKARPAHRRRPRRSNGRSPAATERAHACAVAPNAPLSTVRSAPEPRSMLSLRNCAVPAEPRPVMHILGSGDRRKSSSGVLSGQTPPVWQHPAGRRQTCERPGEPERDQDRQPTADAERRQPSLGREPPVSDHASPITARS